MDSMSDSELDARDGHKLFKNNDGSYNESVVSFYVLAFLIDWGILVQLSTKTKKVESKAELTKIKA